MVTKDDSDSDFYGESSDSNGKSLLLEVPDFNDNLTETVGGNSFYTATAGLASYLRLGAVPTAVTTAYGNSTVANLDKTLGEDLASDALPGGAFCDDARTRNANKRITENQRATETGLLHTRGGWRDHTDGNRITTTRGDKVEVIGGNYKLKVLGRSQWDSSAMTDGSLHFESSGGISYHYDQVPGQFVDFTWINSDGTWRCKEECQKGHFVARYDGEQREWKYGSVVEERVGSKTAYDNLGTDDSGLPSIVTADSLDASGTWPADEDFDHELTASVNSEEQVIGDWPPTTETAPNIKEITFAKTKTEHTWARRIVTYSGSEDYKVKKIIDRVYADTIETKLDVGKMISDDVVTTERTEKLDASNGDIVENRTGTYKGFFDGSSTESWGCGASGTYKPTNFGEVFIGGFESFRLGISITGFTGPSVRAWALSPALDAHILAIAIEYFFGLKWTIAYGACHSRYGGKQVEIQAISKVREAIVESNQSARQSLGGV